MKLKINDQYRVNSDSHCLHLEEKSIVSDENSKNKGSVVWRPIGYYSCLKGLINGIAREIVLKNDDVKTIDSKLEELKTIARRIDKKLLL